MIIIVIINKFIIIMNKSFQSDQFNSYFGLMAKINQLITTILKDAKKTMSLSKFLQITILYYKSNLKINLFIGEIFVPRHNFISYSNKTLVKVI